VRADATCTCGVHALTIDAAGGIVRSTLSFELLQDGEPVSVETSSCAMRVSDNLMLPLYVELFLLRRLARGQDVSS